MNKKAMKVISIMLIALISLMCLTSVAYAEGEGYTPGKFDGSGADVELDKIASTGNSIIVVIRTVGMIAAVVVLMVLGIKYMMGSAEEKASYKKTMIPYLVGAVLLFGASALAEAIYNIAIKI